MSIGILESCCGDFAVLYSKTTETAFGPLMRIPEDHEDLFENPTAYAEAFLDSLGKRIAVLNDDGLRIELAEFNGSLSGLEKCAGCGDLIRNEYVYCLDCKHESACHCVDCGREYADDTE